MIIVALLTSREVTKAHQKDSVSAHFHDKNSCQLYRLWLIRWCIMRCITLDLDYQSALTSCPYSIVETHGHCSMPSSTPHMRSLRYTAASTILFTAGRPTDSFPNAYHGILEGIVYVRFASRLIPPAQCTYAALQDAPLLAAVHLWVWCLLGHERLSKQSTAFVCSFEDMLGSTCLKL